MNAHVRTVDATEPGVIPGHVRDSAEPVLLKGLVASWPSVIAAREGAESSLAYLQRFARNQDVLAFTGKPGMGGRYFYNEDLSGLNFDRLSTTLGALLERFSDSQAAQDESYFYMGSTPVDDCFPGFRADNDVSLGGEKAVVSVWMGNRSRIAAHFDAPENLACVVAGNRRFTLFPPEQLPNLYVGPLDFTPAGQAISLVDFANPDYAAFPRFRDALAAAVIAELEPGDALYLPSMWWHHVEASAPFNMLVNYWWNPSRSASGNPMNVLIHALLSIKGLPPEQRAAWRALFDYYVFDAQDSELTHIPEERLGVLGNIDSTMARQLRAMLRSKLGA